MAQLQPGGFQLIGKAYRTLIVHNKPEQPIRKICSLIFTQQVPSFVCIGARVSFIVFFQKNLRQRNRRFIQFLIVSALLQKFNAVSEIVLDLRGKAFFFLRF